MPKSHRKKDERNIYALMKTMSPPFPQRFCGSSCTLPHDVWLHIAGTNETESAEHAKQGA